MDPSTTTTAAGSTGGVEAAAVIATILENAPPCLTSCIGQATDAVSICTNFAQIGDCVNSQATGCTAPADIARLQAIGPRISSFCSSGIAVADPSVSAAPSAAAAATTTTNAAARAIETTSQVVAAVSSAGAVNSKTSTTSSAVKTTTATTRAAVSDKASGAVGSVFVGFLASVYAMLAL
ncbi:hypothetical protein HDU81_005806 [Chytriomyces hyalinus]|nr:hypothetical protein HDU81_005806 [Chytriomyces hyalinus]